MVPLLTYDCASDETNSACSSGGALSSASHSRVFCASGMLPPDRLPCGRLPCNDDPSKPIVALEAVPVDSLYPARYVPAHAIRCRGNCYIGVMSELRSGHLRCGLRIERLMVFSYSAITAACIILKRIFIKC